MKKSCFIAFVLLLATLPTIIKHNNSKAMYVFTKPTPGIRKDIGTAD